VCACTAEPQLSDAPPCRPPSRRQVAACGLQLYRFGQAVSICFFTPTWRPDSFYDRVATNRREGLHTLCLLDIRVKEPSEESLCRRVRRVSHNAQRSVRSLTAGER
jgi:diphthamide biosynthesis methyltransferase